MMHLANEILIDVLPGEIKVAILEERKLVEVYAEKRSQERMLGNIYKGKVLNILPGMQAAFVDIGFSKNAFLYVNDAVYEDYPEAEDDGHRDKDNTIKKNCNIKEILTKGQEITVQVVKEAVGNKGPRITTQITLPGRYLVLLPRTDYLGVSRRIEDESERNRLKKIAEKIKPQNMGLIVRTAAQGKGEDDFLKDLEFLLKLWDTIRQNEARVRAPKCLHTDYNLFYKTLRDFFTPDIDRLVVNNQQKYEEALDYVAMISPSLKDRIVFFERRGSLFEYYGINYELQKTFQRKVWLKSGGYIIIDHTEALTVIDVNTGKYTGANDLENTVLKTNIEAADEIGRQLRLRDIGGIIIIDFIDMKDQEHKNMVIEKLKNVLKKDRAKTTVVGMTGLGLIEMTRKKIGFGSVNVQNQID